jgi:hypothetical protein
MIDDERYIYHTVWGQRYLGGPGISPWFVSGPAGEIAVEDYVYHHLYGLLIFSLLSKPETYRGSQASVPIS